MIELRTGLPGSGKSLGVVKWLADLQAVWAKSPHEARPLFVHGIKGLALDHAPVPLKKWQRNSATPFVDVVDWEAMPSGSLVVIDEAQKLFPPRSSQSEPPPHVQWLTEHRHVGMDIVFLTQNPIFMDGVVRALVNKHQHFRRLFGRQRSIVYEWTECSDRLGGLANAVVSYFPFPANAYRFYESAEVHTKQSFKLPKWIVIPFIGVAMGIFFVPRAFTQVRELMGGEGRTVATTAKKESGGNVHAIAGTLPPPLPALPASGAVVSVVSAPVYRGCVSMADRCQCVRDDGSVVDAPSLCVESSRKFGYLVKLNLEPPKVAPVKALAGSAVADAGGGGAWGFDAGEKRFAPPVARYR